MLFRTNQNLSVILFFQSNFFLIVIHAVNDISLVCSCKTTFEFDCYDFQNINMGLVPYATIHYRISEAQNI